MVGGVSYDFTAELWRHEGETAWYFVTLPHDVADDIEARQADGPRRGFGSVRVEVTLGRSTWRTSVFPDTKRQSYLLPVKAVVRRAEALDDGDRVAVRLRVVDGEQDFSGLGA